MTADEKSIPVKDDFWKNELLTIKEVAAFLRVGRVTVWRWCKDGLIPACQIGHHWRIPRDDLLRRIEAAQIGYATPANPLPLTATPPPELSISPDNHPQTESSCEPSTSAVTVGGSTP